MKIAIVDDDKKIRQMILEFCEQTIDDGEYFEFADGTEVKDNTYDIIFLDMDLGKNSGIDIAKKLPRSNVVFVSGYPKIVYSDWEKYGKAYLEKPILLSEFREEVQRIKETCFL